MIRSTRRRAGDAFHFRRSVPSNGHVWVEKWQRTSGDEQTRLNAGGTVAGDTLLFRIDYKYDAWGNRIERRQRDYNAAGQVASDVTERHAVDGWDTKQDFWGNTPTPVGNENFDVWADLTASNQLTVRRVHGDGVDDIAARVDANGVRFYHADHLGSIVGVVDGTTGAQSEIAYDAWGQLKSGTLLDRYGYTGREWDAAAELYHYRAREYDPFIGRFLQEDPLGYAAGDTNLYRYVGNQVTGARDPSGLVPEEVKDIVDAVIKQSGPLTLEQVRRLRKAGLVKDLGNGRISVVIDGKQIIYSFVGKTKVEKQLAAEVVIPVEGKYVSDQNTDCFTEESARKVLQGEIARWRKEGWHFAANLLEHFLKNNGKDYTPTKEDVEEAKKFLGIEIFHLLLRHINKLESQGKLNWRDSNKFELEGHLDWDQTFNHFKKFGASGNEPLFYALGGFTYKITGTVIWDDKSQSFKIKLKVKISDKYAFPMTWGRSWFRAYRAGHYLVNCHKYREFDHNFEYPFEFSIPSLTLE